MYLKKIQHGFQDLGRCTGNLYRELSEPIGNPNFKSYGRKCVRTAYFLTLFDAKNDGFIGASSVFASNHHISYFRPILENPYKQGLYGVNGICGAASARYPLAPFFLSVKIPSHLIGTIRRFFKEFTFRPILYINVYGLSEKSNQS